MEWPQHYTSDGNLNIEGDVKNMKFEKADPLITLEVTCVDTVVKLIQIRFSIVSEHLDTQNICVFAGGQVK